MNKFIVGVVGAMLLMGSGNVLAAAKAVVAVGKLVKVDYTLSVDNKDVETSIGKQPLEFVLGNKSVIPGLEKGMMGMRVGEEKVIKVDPADAYGQPDPLAVKEFPKTSMPQDMELKPGMVLQASAPDGNNFPAMIKEVKASTVLLDFNHPLAGKKLQFKIKVVDISDAPASPVAGK